ncbi:MAG: ferritin-like domain-containing protein [Pirellulales bacterium]
MALHSLEDLFVHELRDLYSAEKQLLKALPKMAKAASSANLKQGFEEHLLQTETQVERLEQIFEQLGKTARGTKCVAMEGLIEEGKKLMEEDAEPPVGDAALIAAAQKVEHYEIAGYGTVRTFANLLGYADAEELLQQTLDEEKQTDERLTELAESEINVQATHRE